MSTPNIDLLVALMSETFPLLEPDSELVEALYRVRGLALEFEDEAAQYQQRAVQEAFKGDNYQKGIIRNHNALLHRHCEWMLEALTKAQLRLAKLLD